MTRWQNVADVAALLRTRLAHALPGPSAQRRFAPVPERDGWAPDLVPDSARRAAALILLHDSPHGPAVPLTLRHATLPHHPGQVSLPGGAIDSGESPADAARREAQEEIGIPAERVHLLGPLSTLWVPVSNFLIHPFVGVAHGDTAFLGHPDEVAELLTVPLDTLLDPACLAWGRRDRAQLEITFPYFAVAGVQVWGATAMILGEFACLFDPAFGPPPVAR